MKMQDIFPPVEKCKLIPEGKLEDCAYCWQLHDQIGFLCRTSGCEEVYTQEWKVSPSHPHKFKIRKRVDDKIYPAPTLQELLAATPESDWDYLVYALEDGKTNLAELVLDRYLAVNGIVKNDAE